MHCIEKNLLSLLVITSLLNAGTIKAQDTTSSWALRAQIVTAGSVTVALGGAWYWNKLAKQNGALKEALFSNLKASADCHDTHYYPDQCPLLISGSTPPCKQSASLEESTELVKNYSQAIVTWGIKAPLMVGLLSWTPWVTLKAKSYFQKS